MEPQFPLLKLPAVVLRLVAACLDTKEKIYFSLCSKNSADHIRRLNIKVEEFLCSIGSEISVSLEFDDLHAISMIFPPVDQPVNQYPIPLPLPVAFRFSTGVRQSEETKETHSFQNMPSLKDFLGHLSTIFHCKNVSIALFHGSEQYTLDSLKESFEGCVVTELVMTTDYGNKPHFINILKTFLPVRILSLDNNPFECNWQFRKSVLKYEFDVLQLWAKTLDAYELLFDMDIKQIDILPTQVISPKLNFFIRMWVEGETNVNLESLVFQFREIDLSDYYQETILNGIDNQVVTEEEEFKPICISVPWGLVDSVIAMYDIRRKTDGRRATIKFDRFSGAIRFKLIVWKSENKIGSVQH
ncbi:hypothetical protein CRE_02805 [Caenorhabditis remanei]|uniref:F-box domain-containing protein n=1 Tax=Caenorhabditis remanei TaxID=31234 RepID=E3LX31_CAERE|nr:hypothetical protein CRE_02805 [Caenorhabditis remanei]